jgi:hypothetical protein
MEFFSETDPIVDTVLEKGVHCDYALDCFRGDLRAGLV